MASNFRSWMYANRWDASTGLISAEYGAGLTEFMRFATQQENCIESGMLFCPCARCNNNKFIVVEKVWNHLYRVGFTPNYKIWCYHGELDTSDIGTSSEPLPHCGEDVEMSSTVQMVNDAFTQDIPHNSPTREHTLEEPNAEAGRFFDMLNDAKHPIYDGCKQGHSPLSAATRMMSIKTDYNLSEDCIDAFADFFKDYLPDDNVSPASYYEIEKLVAGIGLPYERIDVCISNCMLFWRGDSEREACRFCGKPRFQPSRCKSRVPFKRMWYLPLAPRLQRLYQSQRTAKEMRWHAEHEDCGEINHPSDALAWKHFRSMYPAFAAEPRNVYLGLCTDGFKSFGKYGRQ